MADLINVIAQWAQNLLLNWGFAELWTTWMLQLVGAVATALASMMFVIFLIWLERKLAGRIQDRFGPNRAGPYGLLQSFADIIKIFTKEYITPRGADGGIFTIAPILGLASVLLLWAVFPFAATVVGADINVGVLFVLAVGTFGILAILMAGWSSNNKYALLGALRAVAVLIAYEIPLVITLLIPVVLADSMALSEIINAQRPWFVLVAPLAALIFLISSLAEIGKAPFDLLEAESELVAGYHTEYSGMRFGMFYVTEFLHQFTVGALVSIFFFGGWRGPFAEQIPILGVFYFYAKTLIWYSIITWIGMTLPRIRIDEMVNFNWQVLIPLSFVNLIAVAIVDRLLLDTPIETLGLGYTLIMLGLNVVIGGAGIYLANRFTAPIKRAKFDPRPLAVPPDSETIEV